MSEPPPAAVDAVADGPISIVDTTALDAPDAADTFA